MLDQIKELITNYVDVDAEEITADSKFIDDLGFNSYDFMSFLGEIEDEFDVEIDERDPSLTTLTPIDRFCMAIHSVTQRITTEWKFTPLLSIGNNLIKT